MNSAVNLESPAEFASRPVPVREEDAYVDPTRRRLWQRLQALRQSRERRAQAALAAARRQAAQQASACAAEEVEHQRTQQTLEVERHGVLQSRIGRPMPRSAFTQIAIEYRQLDARFAASANRMAEVRQALAQAEANVAPCVERYRGAARASERVAEALRLEPVSEH